jgi:hypothetical protein
MTSTVYTDGELLAMPRANLDLLDETLDYIETHQDEWDQSSWASRTECGTTCCFAGTVAVLTGHELRWDERNHSTYHVTSGHSIEQVAREALGLTNIEADRLFIRTLYPKGCDEFLVDPDGLKALRLKAVKVEVERIRYRAREQAKAFAREAERIGEANSKREVVVVQEPQTAKVA